MTRPLALLFVLGDSISVHYGPHLRDAVAGRFHYDRKGGSDARLDNPADVSNINGGDSDRVLEYLRYRLAHDPIAADLMLINCGLHDLKRNPATGELQVPLDRYIANLREIIAVARRMAVRVAWISTTPVDDERHNSRSRHFHRHAADVQTYNAAADSMMAELRVPTIDLFAFTVALARRPSDLYCDHVHFPEDVRVAQGRFIACRLIDANLPA